MKRSAEEIDEYYDGLTAYINANSGLDALTSDQVKMVWRTHKKIRTNGFGGPNTHKYENPTVPDRRDNPRCCTARRVDGEPCRRYSVKGASVCKLHGGAAKQVQNVARARLANAADRMARELLGMATDPNVSDSVKLAAIRDALDRGGVGIKAELEITARAYEQVFEQMELGGKRSDFRGEPEVLDAIEYEPEQIELEAHTDEPLDVEVLDDDGQPFTPDEPEHGLEDDSEPPSPFAPRNPPPEAALLPFDAAVSAAAAMRRSVVSHRATRR
jgi:hypothetical protein